MSIDHPDYQAPVGVISETKILLKVESGPQTGACVTINAGDTVEVGRRGRHLAIPEDSTMSAKHFLIHCDVSRHVSIRDLNSSNGTTVNGVQVTESALKAGDRISAGNSEFRIIVGTEASATPIRRLEGDPLEVLRGQAEPLYAILDAARSPRILEILSEGDAEPFNLYEGKSAETLAEYAPYIVEASSDSLLLEELVKEGWGKSWGIWASSPASLKEIRQHFRRFLIIEVEGRKVYFRFYDPRVLRSFLPTCDPGQVQDFLGPAHQLLFEDGDGLSYLESAMPNAIFQRS